MSVWQQQNQLELDFGELGKSRRNPSSETFIALRLAESPTGEIRLMESICERQNMHRAMRQVRRNGGAPGIDGMTVEQLPGYLRKHWWKIKADLLAGRYRPLPVRRKEIDKPDGGVRLLGIPTVLDRLIQQATAQVLTAIWDLRSRNTASGFDRDGRNTMPSGSANAMWNRATGMSWNWTWKSFSTGLTTTA